MVGMKKSGGTKGTRPAEVATSVLGAGHRETVGDLPRGVVFSDAHGAQAVEPGHAAACSSTMSAPVTAPWVACSIFTASGSEG